MANIPDDVREEMEEKLKKINEEIREVLDKHNVSVGLCFFGIRGFDLDEAKWEHPSDRDYYTAFTMVNDPALADKVKPYLDNDFKGAGTEVLNMAYDIQSMLCNCAGSAIEGMMRLEALAAARMKRIKELLGMDTAQVFSLECNKFYRVFTTDTEFRLHYNENFQFFVEKISGPLNNPPDGPLRFYGCVQDDGEIFGGGELPLISTNDRMLFGEMKEWEDTKPSYISTPVTAVVEENSLN